MTTKIISIYYKRTNLGIKYNTCDYDTCKHVLIINLVFFSIFITLPFTSKTWTCEPKEYGIETYRDHYTHWYDIFDQIYITLGNKYWFIEMPWYMDWTYTAIQTKDKEWIVEDYKDHKSNTRHKRFFENICIINSVQDWKYNSNDEFQSKIYYEYKYTYKKINQTSNCKYYVCERCWRPKWFKWTDLFSEKIRYIDVEFENGMGSGVDDWKGGTYGVSFDMKENETPEECIRRMEQEYIF